MKKYIKIIHSLIFATIMLVILCAATACGGLVQGGGGSGAPSSTYNDKLELTGDYGIGFNVFFTIPEDCPLHSRLLPNSYLDTYQDDEAPSSGYARSEDGYITYPTNKFQSERAYSFYLKRNTSGNVNYIEQVGSTEIFSDVTVDITGEIGEVGGKLVYDVTFPYTDTLQGAKLYHTVILRSRENRESSGAGEQNYDSTLYLDKGSMCNTLDCHDGNVSMSSYETASKTVNGVTVEGKYEFSLTVNFKYVPYMTSARILEYDASDNIIKTSLLSESDRYYVPMQNCEYVILEKSYRESRHDYFYKAAYVERDILSRSEEEKTLDLPFPLENGFINTRGLKICFNGAPSGMLVDNKNPNVHMKFNYNN